MFTMSPILSSYNYNNVPTHYASFFLTKSLSDLSGIIDIFIIYDQTSSELHFTLDIGAPKTICNESFLSMTSWTPVQRVELPNVTSLFRFAGHLIRALYGVCLSAHLNGITFGFVLSDVPAVFLLDLQN